MSSSTSGAAETGSSPHPLVQLARATIEKYVLQGKRLKPSEAPAPIEGGPAGVFVTIHKASTGEKPATIGTS